jgi:hypothetical protein
MLTSVTTFAGLTPLLLEKSLQARFLIPMAVSLGFGVVFATIITLMLIPVGYSVLASTKRKFGMHDDLDAAEAKAAGTDVAQIGEPAEASCETA